MLPDCYRSLELTWHAVPAQDMFKRTQTRRESENADDDDDAGVEHSEGEVACAICCVGFNLLAGKDNQTS